MTSATRYTVEIPAAQPTYDLNARVCDLLVSGFAEKFLGSAELCLSFQACHGALGCRNATWQCSQGVGIDRCVCVCVWKGVYQSHSKFTLILLLGLPSGSQLTARCATQRKKKMRFKPSVRFMQGYMLVFTSLTSGKRVEQFEQDPCR